MPTQRPFALLCEGVNLLVPKVPNLSSPNRRLRQLPKLSRAQPRAANRNVDSERMPSGENGRSSGRMTGHSVFGNHSCLLW